MSDDKIQEFVRVRPSSLFLVGLSLERELLADGGAGRFRMKIELAESVSEDAQRWVFGFEGVCNLRLGAFDGLFGLMVEIRDLAGHQLEEIRYGVVESEYEVFAFECADFSFKRSRGPGV